jgi:hypothetical protein
VSGELLFLILGGGCIFVGVVLWLAIDAERNEWAGPDPAVLWNVDNRQHGCCECHCAGTVLVQFRAMDGYRARWHCPLHASMALDTPGAQLAEVAS